MRICLFVSALCIVGYITLCDTDTEDTAGHCYEDGSYHCSIYTNETQLIKTLLASCNGNATTIFVTKGYESTKYGDLLIDLELPSNIKHIYINNYKDHDYIRLTTSVYNTELVSFEGEANLELQEDDFFDYFKAMQKINVQIIKSKLRPSFSSLSNLTHLNFRIAIPQHLDNIMFVGLSNLEHLDLSFSKFIKLCERAFENLNVLTYLSLASNKITKINEGAFSGLSSLNVLDLTNNRIVAVSDYVLDSLIKLHSLYLSQNPGLPLEALLQTYSIQQLFLQYNDYVTLNPYIFQQMNSLTRLHLNDPFVCDCRIQWFSFLRRYGVYLDEGAALNHHTIMEN